MRCSKLKAFCTGLEVHVALLNRSQTMIGLDKPGIFVLVQVVRMLGWPLKVRVNRPEPEFLSESVKMACPFFVVDAKALAIDMFHLDMASLQLRQSPLVLHTVTMLSHKVPCTVNRPPAQFQDLPRWPRGRSAHQALQRTLSAKRASWKRLESSFQLLQVCHAHSPGINKFVLAVTLAFTFLRLRIIHRGFWLHISSLLWRRHEFAGMTGPCPLKPFSDDPVHLNLVKLAGFEHLSANRALQLCLWIKEFHLQAPEATILAVGDLLHWCMPEKVNVANAERCDYKQKVAGAASTKSHWESLHASFLFYFGFYISVQTISTWGDPPSTSPAYDAHVGKEANPVQSW